MRLTGKRVALVDRRRRGAAGLDVDEVVPLEEEARADLEERVLVERKRLLVERHRHRDSARLGSVSAVGRRPRPSRRSRPQSRSSTSVTSPTFTPAMRTGLDGADLLARLEDRRDLVLVGPGKLLRVGDDRAPTAITTTMIRPITQLGKRSRRWPTLMARSPPTSRARVSGCGCRRSGGRRRRSRRASSAPRDPGKVRDAVRRDPKRLARHGLEAERVADLPGLAVGVLLAGRRVEVRVDDRHLVRLELAVAVRVRRTGLAVGRHARVAAERRLDRLGRREPGQRLAERVAEERLHVRERVREVGEPVVPVVADGLRGRDVADERRRLLERLARGA